MLCNEKKGGHQHIHFFYLILKGMIQLAIPTFQLDIQKSAPCITPSPHLQKKKKKRGGMDGMGGEMIGSSDEERPWLELGEMD